jgi:hypothetical protein
MTSFRGDHIMTRRTLLPLMGGVAAFLAIVFTFVQAQGNGNLGAGVGVSALNTNPIGSQLNCPNRCRAFLRGLFDAPSAFTTSGTGTFTTTANTAANKDAGIPASTDLAPASWRGTGHSDELGDITWEFDLGRGEVQTSRIVANQVDADFPATGDLYVYIRGTISSVEGGTYQSQTPLHFRSTNITSFNPIRGATFTLTEDVPFERVDRPGAVAFTLSDLSLSIDG